MNATVFCNKCGTSNAAASQFCSHCGTPMGAVVAAPPAAVPVPAAPLASSAGAYAPAVAYPAVQPGVGYGGFWIRFVAAILDAIIVNVVVMPLSFVVGGVSGVAGSMSGISREGLPILGGALGFLIGLFGGWLYAAFMESSTRQATLGKMICGMRVTDMAGNRISFGRATGRHFAKWVSALALGVGFIMAGFTERKQGLHDILAGTLVRRP